MRIVPIGLVYWRGSGLAREIARTHSRITHPSLACVEACEAYTELVCRVMNGWFLGDVFFEEYPLIYIGYRSDEGAALSSGL